MLAVTLLSIIDAESQDVRERYCDSNKVLQLSAIIYLALWPAHHTFHALETDSR